MATATVFLALICIMLCMLILVYSWYDVMWWCFLVIACCWSIVLTAYRRFSFLSRIYPHIDPEIKTFHPLPSNKISEKPVDAVQIPVGLKPIMTELCDLIVQDFVESWFTELVKYKPEIFLTRARQDIDYVCGALCQLLSSVDHLEFITQDMPQVLNDHVHQVQQAFSSQGDLIEPFVLHECAKNPEKEAAHLTVLARLMCDRLLPPHHDHLSRDLAVGVLTKQVLQPMVDSMTNPDNINQSLLFYLMSQEALVTSYKRLFTYAASYEDFVELILKCNDIEELKQIRYHIITEIMYSTTLQGLKSGKSGDDTDAMSHATSRLKQVSKASMLKNRDLKRYANQLKIAKSKCEKRITNLGGEEYAEYFAEEQSSNQHRGHKVISFRLTMYSLACRASFHSFLKADDSESLLEYWVAAETLKSCELGDRHRLAAEIYSKYIASSVTLVKLDKVLLKGMEAFLIGNRGPEAFYEGQEVVYHQLEEKHYPQFLVSNVYHQFIVNWDGGETTTSGETVSYGSNEDYDEEFQDLEDDELDFQQTASDYNKKKIAVIDEKIFNKTQAHQVITSQQVDSSAPSSKYLSVLTELENELEALKLERRGLEAHQEQVESWWKHIGQWSATVVQHEVTKEDDGWIVYYLVLIRLQDQQIASPLHRNGWVVTRTLHQIKALHRDLCQIDEDISQLALPSKVRIGKPGDEYIKKAKLQISNFLEWVIADRTLSQSSELFHFASTHPHLNNRSGRKSSTFTVPKIFKRRAGADDAHSADLLFYNQHDIVAKELIRSKDSIAGPLYSLISEIFELKGAFKLLRKTLVQLVQVTYGKSINRQIRETVNWMISEPMLVYYLKFFRDFFWPDGVLAPPNPITTDEERKQIRLEAKSALTRNIPEFVIRIFGDKSAKRGFTKVFDTFQDQRLNKHFTYVLLSRFTDKVFPEITDAKLAHYRGMQFSEWTIHSMPGETITDQHERTKQEVDQPPPLTEPNNQAIDDSPILEQSTTTNHSRAPSTSSHAYKRYIHLK